MSETKAPGRTTLIAFGVAVLMGGSNFVAVRYSNEELPPLFGAGLRFTIASALLFAIVAIRHLELPRGRATVGALVYGILGFGMSYAFLYYALVGLSAGASSVILASSPLLTLLLAAAHGQEKITTRGLFAGVLAIVGIGVLSSSALTGGLEIKYVLASVLGALSLAESSVLVKGYPKVHPVTTNAIGMAAGAALLLLASWVAGDRWALPSTGRTWLVLGWLVIFGSVVLFILFLYVIERWTASAAVYAVTLMPLVAVTEGALIADEPITLPLLAGGALVLTAAYIGAISQGRRPVIQAPEPLPATTESPAAPRG